MYLKPDESLTHSSFHFLLELAMQLRKYIWILRVIEWMKCMYNLTDKFVPGIALFMQIIVSSLVGEKKYKCLSLTGIWF